MTIAVDWGIKNQTNQQVANGMQRNQYANPVKLLNDVLYTITFSYERKTFLLRKQQLVALLKLCFNFHMAVSDLNPFLMVPWICL